MARCRWWPLCRLSRGLSSPGDIPPPCPQHLHISAGRRRFELAAPSPLLDRKAARPNKSSESAKKCGKSSVQVYRSVTAKRAACMLCRPLTNTEEIHHAKGCWLLVLSHPTMGVGTAAIISFTTCWANSRLEITRPISEFRSLERGSKLKEPISAC